MRRSVSANMKIMKYVYMAIGSLFLVLFINELILNNAENALIFYGVVILIMIGLYLLTDNLKNIEYDNQYLYITSHSVTEQIPKKNIVDIYPTSIEINNKKIWKIKYKNQKGVTTSAKFIPKIFEDNLNDFINELKYIKNQKVM